MAEIQVQKVADKAKETTLPLFKEMEGVLERIRARAFDLFSRRGFSDGHALDTASTPLWSYTRRRLGALRSTCVCLLAVSNALALAILVFTSIANVSGSEVAVSPWVFVLGIGMLIFLIFVSTGKNQ